jgi:hypothetical protein
MEMFCDIDWSATGSMLSGIGALCAALAAAFAVFFAYPDWVKREKFRLKSENAIRILACFYEGEQVVRFIRNPIVTFVEIQAAHAGYQKETGNADAQPSPRQIDSFTVQDRVWRHQDYWEKLYGLLPVAKATFGENVFGQLKILAQVRAEILASAQSFPSIADEDEGLWRRRIYLINQQDDEILNRLQESERRLSNELLEFIH